MHKERRLRTMAKGGVLAGTLILGGYSVVSMMDSPRAAAAETQQATPNRSIRLDTVYPAEDIDKVEVGLNWQLAPTGQGNFAAHLFSLGNGRDLYIGFATIPESKRAREPEKEERQVIFAVWDKADGDNSAQPGAGCRRFVDEGSGATCQKNYAWKTGSNYILSIERVAANGDDAVWAGYVTNPETGERFEIGQIATKGMGITIKRNGTLFLENYFSPRFPCSHNHDTEVIWSNPTAWVAGVPYYPTGRINYVDCLTNADISKIGPNTYSMKKGINVVQVTPDGTTFSPTAQAKQFARAEAETQNINHLFSNADYSPLAFTSTRHQV